jgi:hypothetical protein
MTALKALSVRQPWAGLIAAGTKDVENRGRQTQHRGLIAIHASLRPDEDAHYLPHVRSWYKNAAHHTKTIAEMQGVILAVAELDGCHQAGTTTVACCPPWGEPFHGANRAWHWRLRDVRPITPIPARGQLGLWNVPDDITARITDLRVKELTA